VEFAELLAREKEQERREADRPVAKNHALGNLSVEFPELFAGEKEQERREADRVDQSS
jgi:hypothetical protein